MKKILQTIGLCALLLGCAVIPGSFTGCATRIATEEIYKGDKTLYLADKSIDESYTLLATFLRWERNNRETLRTNHPEIKKAADQLRREAPTLFQDAVALRDIYAVDSSAENKTALEKSLALIRGILTQISEHMTKGSK